MPVKDYLLLSEEQKYPEVFCKEEEIALAKNLRNYVDKEIMPRRHDLEGGWHRDEKLALVTVHKIYADLVKLGATKTLLPEKYGGSGYGPMANQIVKDELARGDIGISVMISAVHWVTSIMLAAGRDDLLQELSPKLGGEEAWVPCVAITEPSGGANIEDPALKGSTLRTIARKEGDSYILNGHKIWPGSGGPNHRFQSEYIEGHMGYWTVATTDPSLGEEGIGIFYVPVDAEGLSFSSPYEKMGFCWTDENVEIWYENVRIPERYRIDTKPGQGAKLTRGFVIGGGRLGSAATLTGLSQAVLEIALDYTKDRTIAGKSLREHSMFAGMFGEMFRAIDISRQYYLATTSIVTNRKYGRIWEPHNIARISAARSFAADTAEKVTNWGMELMGAYGYSYEGNVEKYMRDFKIVKQWLGGPQRDRLDIAQGLYGIFNW